MAQYSFTCGITGCGMQMTTQAENADEGARALIEQAKMHLAHVHPEVHKTDEEVDTDIRSHMVTKE